MSNEKNIIILDGKADLRLDLTANFHKLLRSEEMPEESLKVYMKVVADFYVGMPSPQLSQLNKQQLLSLMHVVVNLMKEVNKEPRTEVTTALLEHLLKVSDDVACHYDKRKYESSENFITFKKESLTFLPKSNFFEELIPKNLIFEEIVAKDDFFTNEEILSDKNFFRRFNQFEGLEVDEGKMSVFDQFYPVKSDAEVNNWEDFVQKAMRNLQKQRVSLQEEVDRYNEVAKVLGQPQLKLTHEE